MKYPSKEPQIVPSPVGRFYDVGGQLCPSASTIPSIGLPIQPYLHKWKIQQCKGDYDKYLNLQNSASRIGSAVHQLCERFTLGEVVDVASNDVADYCDVTGVDFPGDAVTQIRNGFRSFVEWFNHHKPEVIAVEPLVWCEETDDDNNLLLPFAGRVDMVCNIDGVNWLLDIKTSKVVKDSLSYLVQLNIYRLLWNRTCEPIVDKIGIIHAKKDFLKGHPPKSVLDIVEYPINEEIVWDTYKMFNLVYKGYRPDVMEVKNQQPTKFYREV